MEKLISVAVMRDSDAAEIAGGTDSKILMYRAGLGIFRSFDWHGKIDIVTGSGNNAGDGYVLALLLHRHGIPCRIVRTSEKCSPDGSYFFTKCQERGIPVTAEADFSGTDQIVDCLLGTGFRGELRPNLRQVVEQINQSAAAVLSVDINSGMNGDTGTGFCVLSDRTVSVGCLKYGHLLGMAQGKIRSLYNYDIGIPCKAAICLCLPRTTAHRRTGTLRRRTLFHKFWTVSTFLPERRHSECKNWQRHCEKKSVSALPVKQGKFRIRHCDLILQFSPWCVIIELEQVVVLRCGEFQKNGA